MATKEHAERITVTLPPDMLASLKAQVEAGSYGSTSEVIREAVRLWQRSEAEQQARLELIRARLEQSARSGSAVPIEAAFAQVEAHHKHQLSDS